MHHGERTLITFQTHLNIKSDLGSCVLFFQVVIVLGHLLPLLDVQFSDVESKLFTFEDVTIAATALAGARADASIHTTVGELVDEGLLELLSFVAAVPLATNALGDGLGVLDIVGLVR